MATRVISVGARVAAPPFPLAANDYWLLGAQRGVTGYSATAPSSTASNSNNTAIFLPFYVDKSIGVDALAIHCTAANAGGSAVVRLGLFNDSSGRPGTVAVDAGTQSINATGVKTATFSAVTLTAGWYWAVLVAQGLDTAGTNPTFSYGSSGFLVAGETTPQASNNLYTRFTATISGALANSPTLSTSRTVLANVPHIWMRVSTP